jgi:plastocyanin
MKASILFFTALWIGASAAAVADGLSGQVILGRGPAREAVVTLESDKKAAPLSHAVIDQRDKTFIPHVTVVTTGTTVQFPNHDSVFHNVFAYFNAKKFDLGMYPRGASKTVTFEKKGLVSLLCNVHSEMSAYILVVDTPYYAVTDKQGRYQLKNVPAGNYVLHAWHESGASVTQTITVNGDSGTLNLTLARK